MPIRGGGLRSSTWTLRRAKEWNRHLGASLSMRIIASWFGSCWPAAYKYASVIIRQQRAPLGIDACEIGLSQSILSSPGRKHADTLNLVKEVTQCLEVSLDRMNPIQVQHLGALGLTKERSDFPSLSAAFRCISRCEGGSEERKNRVGSKCWGVALRVGIQG